MSRRGQKQPGRVYENQNSGLYGHNGQFLSTFRTEHELQNVPFRYWATSLNVTQLASVSAFDAEEQGSRNPEVRYGMSHWDKITI